MRQAISWKWLGLCAYDDALVAPRRRVGNVPQRVVPTSASRSSILRRSRSGDAPPPSTYWPPATSSQTAASRATRPSAAAVRRTMRPVSSSSIRSCRSRRAGSGSNASSWTLEELMLEIAAAAGVHARRDVRGRGIWTERGKLGAVGIRVRDGVTMHGLALNVCLDLAGFDLIAPCGTRGLAVTSLAAEGASARVLDVLLAAERACARLFGQARAPSPRDRHATDHGGAPLSRAELALVDRMLAGDRVALAKLMTRVENEAGDVAAVMARIYPRLGRADTLGVTGPARRRQVDAGRSPDRRSSAPREQTVGVVAVDPSSPVQRRRRARRPHPHAEPLPRSRRLHPQPEHAWPPRRPRPRDADRCAHLLDAFGKDTDHHRDRRRRADRARHHGAGARPWSSCSFRKRATRCR